MNTEETWRAIERQRLAIADLLDSLEPQQWETPSLSVGWRVRDVAAHVAMGAQVLPVRTMLAAAVRARGSFDRLNDDMAVAYAVRPPAVLVQELRELAASRELPAVTNCHNSMFDVLVHSQDVAIPLGLPLDVPADAASAAATTIWQLGWPFWTRRRFRGLRFRATDTDWSAGEGLEVRGPISVLILGLTGRSVALPHLEGPGHVELSRRIERRSPQPAGQDR